MKIKLAILDKDTLYLSRISTLLSNKYNEKFEVYSFTDVDVAVNAVSENKVDVFLANDYFEVDKKKIPGRCGFAYLVDSPSVKMVNDEPAICKYQKIELTYKQILAIYSDKAGVISDFDEESDKAKIITFFSVSGGAGSSSMAAACAKRLAFTGKKTLYLNLELFGSSDTFFEAEGQFDMSDIIYTLKSKKTNIALKLESCVKQDSSGVYFYSSPKLVLDMLEISKDDITVLLDEASSMGTFDVIVVDIDFFMKQDYLDIYRKANSIVVVGDGSEISNRKTESVYAALATMESGNENSIIEKMCIVYNKFSNKVCKTIGDENLRSIGGAPRYEHASAKQVVDQLSKMNMFDSI